MQLCPGVSLSSQRPCATPLSRTSQTKGTLSSGHWGWLRGSPGCLTTLGKADSSPSSGRGCLLPSQHAFQLSSWHPFASQLVRKTDSSAREVGTGLATWFIVGCFGPSSGLATQFTVDCQGTSSVCERHHLSGLTTMLAHCGHVPCEW